MALNDEREHHLMVAIFSVAAAMVGVCLTGIGLLQVFSSARRVGTLADELLVADAALFLGCCFFAFLSFRVRQHALQQKLRKVADTLFFLGLLLMAVTCGLIALTLV